MVNSSIVITDKRFSKLSNMDKDMKKKPILFLMVLVFLFISSPAFAEINVERLANAIYRAENSKSHPYGILTHYKHTTPRQACINTINHALKDWRGNGDFIAFLGSRYCPVGVSNDPHGLNKNWVKNVTHFYKEGR